MNLLERDALLRELTDRLRRARPDGGGVVLVGGDVRPGDSIRVEAPQGPHRPLLPV